MATINDLRYAYYAQELGLTVEEAHELTVNDLEYRFLQENVVVVEEEE